MPRTILLADDEAHVIHVLRLRLEQSGYAVLTARDGKRALAEALEHNPDVIISDYQMPEMTGVEFARGLAAAGRATPIVLLTARGHKLRPEDLAGTSVLRVMDKPFSARDAVALVAELLGAAPGLERAA